jgi:hypothetical protein
VLRNDIAKAQRQGTLPITSGIPPPPVSSSDPAGLQLEPHGFETDIFAWLSNPDNLDPTPASGRQDGLSASDGTMFPWLNVSQPHGKIKIIADILGRRSKPEQLVLGLPEW